MAKQHNNPNPDAEAEAKAKAEAEEAEAKAQADAEAKAEADAKAAEDAKAAADAEANDAGDDAPDEPVVRVKIGNEAITVEVSRGRELKYLALTEYEVPVSQAEEWLDAKRCVTWPPKKKKG